jgi:hypothetical protein
VAILSTSLSLENGKILFVARCIERGNAHFCVLRHGIRM